ncbi:hypothetical protein G5714_001550 [Onychostoma macrolepis]|uniref:Uncharacterized protein n=1 Tax=Onychostoma macrolepis TaxID=369639 RepID=A0A7J6DCG1_9TELE|nr:hypothetical protein G5714_001550 [Onychostoma macrolepis]
MEAANNVRVIVEVGESDGEINGAGIEWEGKEGTGSDGSEEALDRALIGAADEEGEQISTEDADMWTEETSDREGVLMTGSGPTSAQGPIPPRRNPKRNRHPPIKLSLESQVVKLESDLQKIERGRKVWLKAKNKRSSRALHAP